MNLRELLSTLDSFERPLVVESTPIKEINKEIISEEIHGGIAKELVESFGYEYIYEAEVGQVVNFSGEPYKWMGAQWQNTKTGKVAEKGIKAHLDKLSLIQPVVAPSSDILSKAATKTALKTGGKLALKAAPFVGTGLSVKDAYDRWKSGDKTGSVIAALAGAGWLIPGPVGWAIGGGLDAANLARDFNKSSSPKQGAMPSVERITALQKELKTAGEDLGTFGPDGDGIDGKLGNYTWQAIGKHPEIAAKYKDVVNGKQAAQPATDTAKPAEPTAPVDTRTELEKYYDNSGK
jgi:hypothetical protein